MKILLRGFAFALPYHVMRCTAAAGHHVTVLGNGRTQALLRPPRCADLYLSDFDYRAPAIATLPPQTVKLYPASLWSLATSWRLSRKDRQMLRYYWRERALPGMRIDDSDVFVRTVEENTSPTE